LLVLASLAPLPANNAVSYVLMTENAMKPHNKSSLELAVKLIALATALAGLINTLLQR
jgi:hypothetical protein